MNAEVDVSNVQLETERLFLRPWRREDVDDLYEYASVPGVGENAGWRHHQSIDESGDILLRFIGEKKTFALVYKENNKAIGSLGLETYKLEEKLTEFIPYRGRELGFVLSKDYWGYGLMPEAVNAVIDYCFNVLDFDFLLCGHFERNLRSKRVQQKCGFKPYRKMVFDTALGTKEPGILSFLSNPRKNNHYEFSHPETLMAAFGGEVQ